MNYTFQSQALRALASLILLIPLFIGSLSSHPPVSITSTPGMDGYAHLCGFFAVSAAIFFLQFDRAYSTFFLLIVLAISLEMAQSFVEARQVDAMDATVNIIGVLGAFAIVKLLRVWLPAPSRHLMEIYPEQNRSNVDHNQQL
jgi:VanZ family protein